MDWIEPFTWKGVLTALLCGGIVGLERQLRGKPAGMRTCIMICLGAYIFVRLGATLAPEHMDPSRVLGQVITGIGFLGAGVILARGEIIVGITSASVVWVLAAVGAVIGLGRHLPAIILALITVAILIGIEFLELRSHRLRRGVHARDGDEGGASRPGLEKRQGA